MFAKASLLAAVLAAVTLAAASDTPTTPPYQGALLIQVGQDASKCLSADNTEGAPVKLAQCTGGSDQEWSWQNGQVQLHNGAMCLTIAGGNTANGSKMQVSKCSTSSFQEFQFTPWGQNQIKWTNGNKCVDVGNSLAIGSQVGIYDCYDIANQTWDMGYMYNALPHTSEKGQAGINDCGATSSQSSSCQNVYLNDVNDFCLWAPPNPNGAIGETEREEVSWCVKEGHGTRVMPEGTLTGVHWVTTKDYVQVTGMGDFTKINVKKGDYGGELDPHGADGNGNPIGGLVFGSTFSANLQYHEWTSFISEKQFCFRACTGANAKQNCGHIWDEMGCDWNMPASYEDGKFESCKGDNDLPMGIYDGKTWSQGTSPTPSAHPVAPSSECVSQPTITAGSVKRDLSLEKMVKMVNPAMPTPPPTRR